MTNVERQFLEESIQLELNMSDLYQLFYVKFPEDSQFWWNLSLEEVNHASLIRSINDLFLPERIIPDAQVESQAKNLKKINKSIREKIKKFKEERPLRRDAFDLAFELENSFGEIHYQLFMNDVPETDVDRIFQRLNGEDKNHAVRIRDYMKLNKIG